MVNPAFSSSGVPKLISVGPSISHVQPMAIQESVDATKRPPIDSGSSPPPESITRTTEWGGATVMDLVILMLLYRGIVLDLLIINPAIFHSVYGSIIACDIPRPCTKSS